LRLSRGAAPCTIDAVRVLRVLRALAFVALPIGACGGAAATSNAGGETAQGSTAQGVPSVPSSTAAAASAGESTVADGGAPAVPSTRPEPIGAELPTDLGKTPPFARRAACPDKGACLLKGIVPLPEGLAAQIDSTLPFFMWEQVLPRQVVMSIPRHVGLDLYVLLLEGEVSIKADDIVGKQKRLWRWNAARVPGLGVAVESKEPTRAIFVYVTNTPGATMGQASTVAGKVSWAKRPSPVVSVEVDKQPDLAWGGGAYHARLGFAEGPASLESLLASKDAPVPEHTHDKEWEILAIVSGDGTLVRKLDGREDDTKVSAGMFASIPPGVPHAYRPAGTAPLVAVQLYAPPGPEQRFKKLASEAAK
jgi:mannose-6-phosphate isomerase-like protein (cupin superfamily)